MHNNVDEFEFIMLKWNKPDSKGTILVIWHSRKSKLYGQKRDQWFSGTGAGEEVDYTETERILGGDGTILYLDCSGVYGLREVLIRGIATIPCVNQRDHLSLSLGQLWGGRWVELNQLDTFSWDFESWEYVTKSLRIVVGEFHCVNSNSMWTDGPELRLDIALTALESLPASSFLPYQFPFCSQWLE